MRLYWQYLAAWSPWFAIPAAMTAFAIAERVFTVSCTRDKLRIPALMASAADVAALSAQLVL